MSAQSHQHLLLHGSFYIGHRISIWLQKQIFQHGFFLFHG
jgi:hypothetical protein